MEIKVLQVTDGLAVLSVDGFEFLAQWAYLDYDDKSDIYVLGYYTMMTRALEDHEKMEEMTQRIYGDKDLEDAIHRKMWESIRLKKVFGLKDFDPDEE